jgi:hypothetical protein
MPVAVALLPKGPDHLDGTEGADVAVVVAAIEDGSIWDLRSSGEDGSRGSPMMLPAGWCDLTESA